MLTNNKKLMGEDTYLNLKNTVNECLKDVVSADELEGFNQHIDDKLADFNPTLMVYGTYNAGKSSLLNALFGQEEKARTGDSPETAEIHAHNYNGYTIYDTPGINAPIEHEEVTTDHLKKTEMVLFVMSNDGSLEEEYVYEKISEIIKSDKPLVIVLNNKRGIDINSKEALDEIDKVNINLSKIGDRNGIEKIEGKISLCMVNAITGLKGKLENKKLILKKSNLLQLEELVDKKLSESGSKEVVNALNSYIEDFIELVIDRINQSIDNVQTKKIEELITSFEKLKQGSGIRLGNQIDKQMSRLADDLEPMFLGDVTEDDIRSCIDSNVKGVVQQADIEFKKINSELKTKINIFSVEFKKVSADYLGELPESESTSSNDSLLPVELEDQVKGVLKNKKVVEEGTKQLLTLAKKWLPKAVMSGKGPVWIGKVAGKAGPIITVAVEAFGAYSAYKEHQQMIEQERNRTLSARNTANYIVDEVKVSLNTSINESLSSVFDNLIIDYRESVENLSGRNQDFSERKNKLREVLVQLL